MNNNFTSHGRQYTIDQFGAIHQTDARSYIYDENYVGTYDTPAYQRGNELLQAMRMAFMIAAHGSVPKTICDVGYGNGAFLKAMGQLPVVRYGKDVTGKKVEGVEIVDDYVPVDVYTFHDCLEHIEDLSFLSTLPGRTLIVSLPWCHYVAKGLPWFDSKYKHRKPDEHLHHFNDHSLMYTMLQYGWQKVATSNHEDLVRVSAHGLKNILTMAFRRR